MSVSINRRTALAWSGRTLLLVATGGMLRPAAADGLPPDGDAYSPWQYWNAPSLKGTPLALVAAGVLAANPHDTQPWLFRISDGAIEIFADLSRNLGAMDSYVREMHLGLGCAIQNMLLVAGPNGYAATLDTEPGSLTALAARTGAVKAATLRLERRAPTAPDALARAIPNRHTNRYPYDRKRAVPRDWRDFAEHPDISDDVRIFLFEDGAERQMFDTAVIDATIAIVADRTMIADSDRWLRMGRSEIEKHRDGPTLETAGLSALTYMFAKIFPVSPETAHQGWIDLTRAQLATARLTGFIAVRDRYDRASAITAGRAWQRLHLGAIAHGVAMQPVNQPIEMIDRERAAGRSDVWNRRMAQLTSDDWQATFSFRAGIPTDDAPLSPRRALKDVVTQQPAQAGPDRKHIP
jgi:nitroreductase